MNPGERILTIEDAYELFTRQENAVALNAVRTAQVERKPTRLLEASLQMRPDRIILGELWGRKAGPPVKRYFKGSVDLVVQLSRRDGRRGVADILAFRDQGWGGKRKI